MNVYDEPVEHCIDYALIHNIQHFEINLTPRHSHLQTFTKNRILNLQYLFQTHGFSSSFHAGSSLNLGYSEFFLKRKHINHIIKSIKIGAKLGITHITLHLGSFVGHTVMNYFRRETLKNVIKNLKIVLDICNDYQVTLALENSAKMHSGSDIEMLGDNINDFEIVYNQLDSPWLGFCLDIGHANLNEGAVRYIEYFSDKIKCVHFHDNYGESDQHFEIGNGTIVWDDVFKALKKVKFKGPFVSECFRMQPHKAFELFIKTWEQA